MGAITGETPTTKISIEKMRRNSEGGNRSRTTAREMTDPPQAPMACSSRKNAMIRIDGASAQAAEETMNSARLAYNGGLRPNRSVIGPYRLWPSANPIRNVTMVDCTAAAEVWNTCSIRGSAGRYMSIETGAKACSIPSRNRSSKCRNREMGAVCCAITGEAISVAGVLRRKVHAYHQNSHHREHYSRRDILERTSPKIAARGRNRRSQVRAPRGEQPESGRGDPSHDEL